MVIPKPAEAQEFRTLLRQQRAIAGLSQEALAERAGLSTRAISDLERGIKTRPHPATMRAIADALDLDPGIRAALAMASRPHAGKSPTTPATSGIPVTATPIVGRDNDISLACDILRTGSSRLLTLTGPGGVGKTRLSLAVAQVLAGTFANGVVFVELASIADPTLVVSTIAAALKLNALHTQTLPDAILNDLQGKQVLLLIDNCEHVMDGVRPIVAAISTGTEGVRILATSRSRLHLRAERILPVSPLTLPDEMPHPTTMNISGTPAIELFVQRAQAVRPDFCLSDANAQSVAEICRRLDGLPLAIELAASRIRLLSPSTMEGLLNQRLRLLTDGPSDAPARHRALRATIEWSHDLLSSDQEIVFRRVSVFAGGATLDAITHIMGSDDPFGTIDTIDALVDLGLLMPASSADEDPRFRMLETVREYARERLDESGEAEDISSAHASYMLAFIERSTPMLFGPNPGECLDRLEREEDNFRAALAWSLGDMGGAGDAAISLKLAVALYHYWHMRGRLQEGHLWLERALSHGERVDEETRRVAYLALANIANNLEDHERARYLYQETLRLNEALGNDRGMAAALVGLGMVATSEGTYEVAGHYLERGTRAYQQSGSPADALPGIYAYARLHITRGDYDQAERYLREAKYRCGETNIGFLSYLALEQAQLERYKGNTSQAFDIAADCLARFREMGERRAEATCLNELGHLALQRADSSGAFDRFRTAAAIHLEMRDEYGVVRCLEGLTSVAIQQGKWDTAALIAGTSSEWRARTGTVRTNHDRHIFDQIDDRLRDNLGDVARIRFDEGRLLLLDQALSHANSLSPVTSSDKSSREADRSPSGPRSS
ncbi:MAG TPA: helix-turn-helix domain-containing protein [Thermomicrobiales bacterium]|nr:helix-turn-helix domain-containing protein [Thermomicrobiales bacterium]